MSVRNIVFFAEDTLYVLKNKGLIRQWLFEAIKAEGFRLKELNFIFCSDAYLLKINQEYLHHDTYTDIITFDNSEQDNSILGDIFISVERVRENAQNFSVSFDQELKRVLIHGVLHLLGYKDKQPKQKQKMTQMEDFYLALFPTYKN